MRIISKMSWSGYVDDFRVSGVARYTNAFSPPSSALPRDSNTLACNSFDASPDAGAPKRNALRAGAADHAGVVFAERPARDRDEHLLQVRRRKSVHPELGRLHYAMTVSGFSAPPDAWTLELWAYTSATPAGQTLLCGYSSGAATGIRLSYASGSTMGLTLTGASGAIASAVGSVSAPSGAWNHVAIVFTGVSDGHYYLL